MMPRGTKHLTDADRQRVRTLYYDAKLSPAEIERITGFTLGQIKRSRESMHVGKRTGRPKLTHPVDDGKEATRAKFAAVRRRPKIPLPPGPAPEPNWEQPITTPQIAHQPLISPQPSHQPFLTPQALPQPLPQPLPQATPQATPQAGSQAAPQLDPQSAPRFVRRPTTPEAPLVPHSNPLANPVDPAKTIVLITGANRGIGLEVVRALLRAEPAEEDSPSGGPYHVFLCSRHWSKGEEAAASLAPAHGNSLSVLPLDVTSAASIKWAAQTVDATAGRVDVLVNNAAVMRYSPHHPHHGDGEASAPALLREALETNLVSAHAVSEAFKSLLMVQVPSFKKDKRLLHVTCDLGSLAHRSDPAHASYPITAPEYRVSKAGLNMLAACQRFDLQGSGVRVGVWNAGYTATDLAGLDPAVKRSHGAREPAAAAGALVGVIEGRRDGEFGRVLDTFEGAVPW